MSKENLKPIYRMVEQHRDNSDAELCFDKDSNRQEPEGWFGKDATKCACCKAAAKWWSSEYHICLCDKCHAIAEEIFNTGEVR